jgi:sugar lactone lactonase YvrE
MTRYVAAPLFAKTIPADTAERSPLAALQGAMPTNVAPDYLGEAPVWDHRTNTFYWIDILQRQISSVRMSFPLNAAGHKNGKGMTSASALEQLQRSPMPVTRFCLQDEQQIGFIALTSDPAVLLGGGGNGLFLVNAGTGVIISRGTHPEAHLLKNRFNDGKVDAAGRIVAGTMKMKNVDADPREPGTARLYSTTHYMKPATMVQAVGAVTVSNGLGWSPCGKQFYHVDTPAKTVSAYDYDVCTGAVANKRVVIKTDGLPDGLTVDCEGFLWVAELNKARILRINPATGEVVAQCVVPGVKLAAAICFGGPSLSLLFITTSGGTTPDVAANTLKAQPDTLSGQLFVADVGVCGLPFNTYKLDNGIAKL